MNIEAALKAIIVLLTVMIISIAVIVILMVQMNKENGENPPIPETTPAQTTTAVPPATTPEQTTVPETSLPESSFPETSLPETSIPETSEPEPIPPETSEPEPEPEDFTIDNVYRSNSGTNLNIRAELHAETDENGTVKVTVKVYLEHFTIGIRSRSGCEFKLGDASKTFSTPKINCNNNITPTSTPLYTFEGTFERGAELDLYIKFPCNCLYGGKQISALEIRDTVILEK